MEESVSVTEAGDAPDRFAALARAVDGGLSGRGSCIRLFVAGAVTHVGKTTVCLSILAALRKAGLKACELAYIKPATQCEAPDLLSKWCMAEGIEYVSGENAPLVFYQGFTRSFLSGEQGSSADWLRKISLRVDSLCEGRRVVVVDGVGFPAVGSIVGVDNADVAKAVRAPVVLVCKSGVGAAIDSFSLNCAYFVAKGVPVLGAIFNLGDRDGFNAWNTCAENIELWFSRVEGRRERFYGVVPVLPELDGLRSRIAETDDTRLMELAGLNAAHFVAHVDISAICEDATMDAWCRHSARKPADPSTRTTEELTTTAPKAAASRSEVQAAAKLQGAKGGG